MNSQPKRTALVVDDEDPIRRVMERMLSAAGFNVLVAATGREAIGRFASTPSIDILVTDLYMPEMEGDELARQLRLVQPDLKVLYVTGFADRLFEHRALLWDGEAYLDKPFTLMGLLEAASLVLDGHLPDELPVSVPRPEAQSEAGFPQTLIWQ